VCEIFQHQPKVISLQSNKTKTATLLDYCQLPQQIVIKTKQILVNTTIINLHFVNGMQQITVMSNSLNFDDTVQMNVV